MKYLVIECTDLSDQYECDADRKPICICDSFNKYNKRGYEIYQINDNGDLKLIKNKDKKKNIGKKKND